VCVCVFVINYNNRVLEDQSTCVDPVVAKGGNRNKIESCIGPKRGETFLNMYNCDFIRPTKPDRFGRAMKQIYRTSYVLSHYVHYSTVTTDVAQTYKEFMQMPHSDPNDYIPFVHDEIWEQRTPSIFVDELTQGALVHARTIVIAV
jgi:hypothetical protein